MLRISWKPWWDERLTIGVRKTIAEQGSGDLEKHLVLDEFEPGRFEQLF
jgi:hypothetical protein